MTFFGYWGLAGFLLILLQAVIRLGPKAVDSIQNYSWSTWDWMLFVVIILFMGISEGYKGFQKQVAPRAVARAHSLSAGSPLLHKALAPFFCMSLFHATKKRLIVSWCVYAGIVCLILIVRQIPQPYRGMVDAGVVVGLAWGMIAIGANLILVLTGSPAADPELPGE